MKDRIAKTIAHRANNRELNGLLAFILALGLVLAAWLMWITSAHRAIVHGPTGTDAAYAETTQPAHAALQPYSE